MHQVAHHVSVSVILLFLHHYFSIIPMSPLLSRKKGSFFFCVHATPASYLMWHAFPPGKHLFVLPLPHRIPTLSTQKVVSSSRLLSWLVNFIPSLDHFAQIRTFSLTRMIFFHSLAQTLDTYSFTLRLQGSTHYKATWQLSSTCITSILSHRHVLLYIITNILVEIILLDFPSKHPIIW